MQTITIKYTGQDYFPGLIRGGVEYSFSPTRSERKTLKKKKQIPVSEWAEKNRVLTMSSSPGPWKNERTPYLVGIMDAAGRSFVHTVIICASPQSGKSECVHNFIGSRIDLAPGSALYVYPDELTGRENMRDRIEPMITSSPRLRSYMTGKEDDHGLLRLNLINMPLYIAWARSASRLANKPIRYVVFDETDKYPATAGPKETDPISLGEARTITYQQAGLHKIFKMSTPTVESGFIWQALTTEAQVVFDFWVKCPSCGRLQKMVFDNIRVPDGVRDPNVIETKNLAWYQCAHCTAKWGDHVRDQAVLHGLWMERLAKDANRPAMHLDAYLDTYKPGKIGFHIPSWVSPFVGLTKIMAAWFRAQKDKTLLKGFMNEHKAEPWLDYTSVRSENYILKLKDDRPRGLVPAGEIISGLTAVVDTQDRGFFYEIRAWGYGVLQESWQIREGYVESFAALEQILWADEYQDSAGNKYLMQITVIDAMGHRTAEVYDWCRLNRGRVLPLQGVERMNQPYAFSKLDCYPGTNKQIPGGLSLLRVNTNYYKDLLAAKLETNPADPGAWHYHSETTHDWARQMTAEYVNDKGLWECKPGWANHAWDISGYQFAAVDVIGLKYRAKKAGVGGQGPVAREQVPGVRDQGSGVGVERPGWMNR